MRLTQYAEGGRPFYDDDIQTIQDEAQLAATAVLQGLGQDCVVSGCRVSATGATFTISPGLVWMGGQLLRCQGASGVSLPAALVTSAVSVLDERPYQTGDTKTCIQEQYAVVSLNSPDGLQIYPAGILSLRHALQGAQLEKWEVKWGRLATANYDGTGLGQPGTAAWGWALCNGQNGTDDLRGRFVASYDPDQTAYGAVGQMGGNEQITLDITQLPTITIPRYNGRISYKSGESGGYSPQDGGTTTVGGGQPFDNRPPFYTLAARQWVGF